jgi:hypothetical protein
VAEALSALAADYLARGGKLYREAE